MFPSCLCSPYFLNHLQKIHHLWFPRCWWESNWIMSIRKNWNGGAPGWCVERTGETFCRTQGIFIPGSSGNRLKLWSSAWNYESGPIHWPILRTWIKFCNGCMVNFATRSRSTLLKLEQIMLRGLTQKLDHLLQFYQELHREFRVSVDGSFAGVGLMVGFRENKLIVISPWSAVLLQRQVSCRWTESSGWWRSNRILTLDEILFRLRGEKGSQVGLHILWGNTFLRLNSFWNGRWSEWKVWMCWTGSMQIFNPIPSH